MSVPFLVRGTTAIACALLASTAVLAPAQAAEATQPLRPGAFTTLPLNPAVPSDDDIAAAKQSEASTAAESDRIDALLSDAQARLQETTSATMRANNSYSDALVILEERRAVADATAAKAQLASDDYSQAKAAMAQLASSLYKSGGLNLDMQTFLVGSDADEAMYQAATLQALTESRSATFSAAEASAATSAALQSQADEARKAADEAAVTADESKAQAQSANDTQAALVQSNQTQREALLVQLATLRNTTVELEGARVDALARAAQEAALAEAIENSANAPAPVAPTPGAGAGAGTTPADVAAPSTPVAPVAPVAPVVPAPAAPAAPAPVAPVTPVTPVVPPAPAPTSPPAPAAPVAPVAPATPIAPVTPPAPTTPSGSYTQVMVDFALAQTGKPYAWGGNGPHAFDCSGLVQQAFAAAGKSVPRTGTEQYWAAPQRVPLSELQYGDLLVFDSDGAGNFGHIAIYVGGGKAVQALYYGFPVGTYSIASMTNKIYPYAARY